MAVKKAFASDNYAGVHPEIMDALIKANVGHEGSYGNDSHTQDAIVNFRKHFGNATEVFFAYNGTGANVLGLSILTRSYNSIICSDLAHINVDESTAPEKFLGCKLLTIPTKDGKIYPKDIEDRIIRVGDQHHPQAKVISISQTTEYATVYTVEEVRAISAVAKQYNLYLHMDGSRIANAAVALDKDFKSFTVDAGVDVLSFGGTKNGLMFGEAVLVFNPALAATFPYIRKQGMQLHSKMRFIATQFNALIATDLWSRNARHANHLTARLAKGLSRFPSIVLTQSVQANGIFAIMPPAVIPHMQAHSFFYVWNDKTNEVRLMCSWDTTESDVDDFINCLAGILQ
jgi:threonine aldolase